MLLLQGVVVRCQGPVLVEDGQQVAVGLGPVLVRKWLNQGLQPCNLPGDTHGHTSVLWALVSG